MEPKTSTHYFYTQNDSNTVHVCYANKAPISDFRLKLFITLPESAKEKRTFKVVYLNQTKFYVRTDKMERFIVSLLNDKKFQVIGEVKNLLNNELFKISELENIIFCIEKLMNYSQHLERLDESAAKTPEEIDREAIKNALKALGAYKDLKKPLDHLKNISTILNPTKNRIDQWLERCAEPKFKLEYESRKPWIDLVEQVVKKSSSQWEYEDILVILHLHALTQSYGRLCKRVERVKCCTTADLSFFNKIHLINSVARKFSHLSRNKVIGLAAKVAQARRAGLSLILSTIKSTPVVEYPKHGVQSIYISNEGVIKSLDPKAEKEELQLFQSFSFLESETVPVYAFKTTSLSKLNISLDVLAPEDRRFSINELTREQQILFTNRSANSWWTDLFEQRPANVDAYRYFSSQVFELNILKDDTLPISFDKLIIHYQKGLFFPDQPIRLRGDSEFQCLEVFLKNYKKNGFRLEDAVKVYSQVALNEAFFTFHPENEDQLNLLKNCERLWFYKNALNQWEKVSFKKLYLLWVCGHIHSETWIKADQETNVEKLIKEESLYQLEDALKIPPRLMIPELIAQSRENKSFVPIKNCISKPFIDNLIVFDEKKFHLYNHILSRAKTSHNFYKIFLTLFLGFGDYHQKNVGFQPKKSRAYIALEIYRFSTEHYKNLELLELLKLFLNKEISPEEPIEIQSPEGLKVATTIKEYQDLYEVLWHTSWDLVIFDGDRVTIESETLTEYETQKGLWTKLPIRNFFLQIASFKDHRLSIREINQILALLQNPLTHDIYFDKKGFIWKFIKEMDHEKLIDLILDEINEIKNTFSYYSKYGFDLDIENLNQNIAEKLCHLDQHPLFWCHIQNLLLKYGDKGWSKLELITLDTPEARELRIKIVKSLLPQASWSQLDSYYTRKRACFLYLEAYHYLVSLDSNSINQSILLDLKKILQIPALPFSNSVQESFIQRINELEQSPNESELLKLLQNLRDEYAPTLKKIANAMYPLLADVMELISLVEPNADDFSKGEKIGNCSYPLEEIIKNLPNTPEANRLKTYLLSKIKYDKNKSFFGYCSI